MSKESVTRIEGQPGQTIKPDRFIQKSESSGNTHTYYGQRGETAHGHSVQNSSKGDIVYARTEGGKELKK